MPVICFWHYSQGYDRQTCPLFARRHNRKRRQEVDILARIDKNLRDAPLAGFVAEGSAPFGAMSNSVDAALKRAAFSGMPVVKVGRGNASGFVDAKRDPLSIAGNNLRRPKHACCLWPVC